MYAERGQNLPEAVELIQKALELDPENGYFIDSLGWAYYQQGKYAEALRELQRAAERAKDDPEIFDHLADAYVKNGKVEEAIAAWEKAVSVDKDNRLGDGVKKKLQEAREKQLRAKGESPKPKTETK
jgi:pentatricopeptide repeat protein